MSQIQLFNGVRLAQPGAASKFDADSFDGLASTGVGTVALVGEALGGKPGEVIAFNSAAAMKRYFRSGPLVDAANIIFNPLNDSRVNGGPSLVLAYKTNTGAQAYKTLGDGTGNVLKLLAQDYGAHTNKIKVKVETYNSTGRKITVTFYDGPAAPSPEIIYVDGTAKFSIYYDAAGVTGAGGTAGTTPRISTTVGSDGLISTIALNFASGGLTNVLTINLATDGINTIYDLVRTINSFIVTHTTAVQPWVATVVGTSDQYKFDPKYLESLTNQSVGTSSGAATSIYAVLQDCIDAINDSSSLITAELAANNTTRGAPSTTVETTFGSGSNGSSDNTAWASAFTELEKFDAPGVVACEDRDGSSGTLGSTHTIASIISAGDAHAAKMSATGTNKKERTFYGGIYGTKATAKAQALLINSQHTFLAAQYPSALNANNEGARFGAWFGAAAVAGARAGIEPGEPLTGKFFRFTDLTQHSGWSPEVDVEEMLLSGVAVFRKDRRGISLVKGIMTYTRTDNDVYVEESIITNVKAMMKEFREFMNTRYTGRKATVQTIQKMKNDTIEFWGAKREQGRIVDTVVNGAITKLAYRDIRITASRDAVTIDLEISPVQGINYQLISTRIVPASISL